MKSNSVDEIVLLGGGVVLRSLCIWAKQKSLPISIVTSPRHLAEIHENITLELFLKNLNVRYISLERLSSNELIKFLPRVQSSFCLSLGAAWIFTKDIIEKVFLGRLLNLHGSRLPNNRGGGGFSWQILMNNRFGSCSLHYVNEAVDEGVLVASHEFVFPGSLRIPLDYDKFYWGKSVEFLTDIIEQCQANAFKPALQGQQECFSSYWPRLNTDLNGWIDWGWDPGAIDRFICAFDSPYSGARTFMKGRSVRIKSVCLSPQDGLFHPYQSGLVYRKGKSWICVAIRGGTLIIESLTDDDGLNIFSDIKVGDRFHTPLSYLEKALDRPVYTSTGLKIN